MGKVIRFRPGPNDTTADDTSSVASIATLRLLTNMDADEFSAAIEEEVGWPVPLFVYLQWEKLGNPLPPPEVLRAARNIVARNPIERNRSPISRRQFLGGVIGLSSLAGAGFPMHASLHDVFNTPTVVHNKRLSPDTAADLESLVHSYRRAYGSDASVQELLPGATSLLHLLVDVGRRDQWPGSQASPASLVGQIAVLIGLLNLMGPRNLDAAQDHYSLALCAAREAEDWDLASYALGSLAFHATSVQQPADAQALGEAAWTLAARLESDGLNWPHPERKTTA